MYTYLPGWKTEIRGITEYDKLPENCRKYIEFIEKELEVPITMVSNGPGRHEIIKRNKVSRLISCETIDKNPYIK